MTVSDKLSFHIDVQRVADQFKTLKDEVQADLTKGVEGLANMTHAKVLELATEELTSLSKKYKDNVEFANPSPNFWVVTLKEPAMWIEEGRKSGFMEELLNGKSAKTGKNGKYAIIPFEHSKNPTEQSAKAYDLAKTIQYELKKKGVNWKKIERDEDESPRLGRLHTFNFDNPRTLAQKETHKNPLTKGVAVYQNVYDSEGNRVGNPDRAKDLLSKGKGTLKREVMTFRVISEKSRNEGAWVHPGRRGNKIMDSAFAWAMNVWEREILPAIFKKYK